MSDFQSQSYASFNENKMINISLSWGLSEMCFLAFGNSLLVKTNRKKRRKKNRGDCSRSETCLTEYISTVAENCNIN